MCRICSTGVVFLGIHQGLDYIQICRKCAKQISDAYAEMSEESDGFEKFWEMYPKKIARKPAHTAWKHLTQKQRDAAMAALPQHVSSVQWVKDRGAFVPHASTWIHQRRWEDEIQQDSAWWKAAR